MSLDRHVVADDEDLPLSHWTVALFGFPGYWATAWRS